MGHAAYTTAAAATATTTSAAAVVLATIPVAPPVIGSICTSASAPTAGERHGFGAADQGHRYDNAGAL